MEFVDTNLGTLTEFLAFDHGSRPPLRRCIWIAATFASCVIGFNLLCKFAKAHLLHEAIPKINQHRLKVALWRIAFALWAIVLYSASVWNSIGGNPIDIILQASKAPQCNTTALLPSKQNIYAELVLLTTPASFFLHQLYVSISSFTEPAITSMGGLSLFVCLCNFIQCQNFCLQMLFLLGLNVGTLEAARALYALRSRCKGFDGPPASPFLRSLVPPVFFLLHLFTWLLINFYIFPKMYFSLPSATEVEPPLQRAAVYINLFLMFYAKIQFFDSPAWSLVKILVKKPSAFRQACGLKSLPVVVLLPYSSSLLPELKAIQMKFLMNALPTSAERRIIRKKILSGESQTSVPTSQGKADLLSVIKCVKILKRKMRYRYEQKTANEAENINQSNQEENDFIREDLDEASAGSSQSQDVTDIFIPVPSLPEKTSEVTTDLETTADFHVSSSASGSETETSSHVEKQERRQSTSEDEEDQD